MTALLPASATPRVCARTVPTRLGAALGLSLVALTGAAVSDEVLIRGPSPEVVVTAADVRGEIAAAPERLRKQMTSDGNALVEAVNNVYRRKALAAAATAAGLDRLPEVQAQVERARDLVYVAALNQQEERQLLARLPDMTARAQELYQSQPERYLAPPKLRVRHILLLADSEDARKARLPEAESLLKQLREGGDFTELAAKASQDQANANSGGTLPPFTRGQMVKPFEDAAFALKQPGDLSPVVPTQFGLHIIRLEEIQPEQRRGFDEVKESMTAKLGHDWVVQAQDAWRQGIIDPAKAKVDQPALDAFVAEITGAQPAAGAARPADPKGQ